MTHLLEPVGLAPQDSAVYAHLLAEGRADLNAIARALGLSSARVRRSVRQLADAGLVNRLVGRPVRYVAAPPDVALDALALHRQHALDQLRAEARDLAVRGRHSEHRPPSDLVELIEGGDAVLHTLSQLELGAREEVLIVDCPPYHPTAALLNTNEMQALARGVRYRAIYHAPVLAEPAKMEQLDQYLAAGEQARALPAVRMKMVISDRSQALVPLSFDATVSTTRLLVHPSPLLDALVACFESLWDRATPIGAPAADTEPELSTRDRQILRLLVSGAKDAAIARALGVTERTVLRHISDLLRRLDADTRFQAGVQATHRGWI